MPFDLELCQTLVTNGVTPGTTLRIAAGMLPLPPESWLERARRGEWTRVRRPSDARATTEGRRGQER